MTIRVFLGVFDDFRYTNAMSIHTPTPQRRKKVLIVDDEKTLVGALTMKLQHSGMDAEACYDGNEALQILADRQFDVILLDIHMPNKNGLDVLRGRSSTCNCNTPIYVQTALGHDAELAEAKKLGAKAAFYKSAMSLADIMATIKGELAMG